MSRMSKMVRQEQGVVSLLTVIFFMVFVSLITIGFMGIVIADQRQTIDNDLSASALAAARSGVEDGKRILIYCQANPSASGCAEAINSTTCDVFNTGAAHDLAQNLGIDLDGTTGEGVTGGTAAQAYQQYFTCLMIQTRTKSLSATLDTDGADYIQHLKTVAHFNGLQVKWSGTTSAIAPPISKVNGWPNLSGWNLSNYMPVIQLEVIPYSSASFSSLDTLEAGTKTVFIAPCDASCGAATVSINSDFRVAAGELRNAPGSLSAPVAYAVCSVLGGKYDCSIKLTDFNGDPGGTQYYVRASVLYASTSLELSAYNDTTAVDFDNVQPQIDVTGRTNDVFKRVRTEVAYKPTVPLPRNALDSAAPICKIMTVTNAAISSTYECPAP